MRLIDGDALEKFLSDAEMEATKRKKYVLAGALNVIQGNVRNFPTIEPEPHWIPVTERLPEINGTYIVSYEDASVPMDWFNGHWFFYRTNPAVEETGTITAWQPLPKPFREEGEEE